jgi:hypothetical protein
MKIAWLLMVIGMLLFLEGTGRFVFGIINGSWMLAIGGILTGWLLGGWIFSRGLSRRKDFKYLESKNK